MKLFNFGVRDDYGTEVYLILFQTKRYSLFQAEFDIGEYSSWFELPYLQFSMGNGRLFSFLLTASKFGFSFDIAGRSWRDETFYELNSKV
jgi:hypothetical protein